MNLTLCNASGVVRRIGRTGELCPLRGSPLGHAPLLALCLRCSPQAAAASLPCPEPPRGLREPRTGPAVVGAAPRALLYIGGNSGNNWNLKEAKLHTWLSRAGLEGRPCCNLAQLRRMGPSWLVPEASVFTTLLLCNFFSQIHLSCFQATR